MNKNFSIMMKSNDKIIKLVENSSNKIEINNQFTTIKENLKNQIVLENDEATNIEYYDDSLNNIKAGDELEIEYYFNYDKHHNLFFKTFMPLNTQSFVVHLTDYNLINDEFYIYSALLKIEINQNSLNIINYKTLECEEAKYIIIPHGVSLEYSCTRRHNLFDLLHINNILRIV